MSAEADNTIEQYANQARQLARDFGFAVPLLSLLLETRRLRDQVTAGLRGHQRLGHARDLYLLATQVCGLLAWQSGDMGNYRAADTHAWTAWMCAEQAGDDGARVWVRVTQAKLAYWAGRFGDSLALAEDGLRYESADSARVFLALFRARVLARVARRERASDALARSDTERSDVTGPDLLGGTWGMTEVRYHGLAAHTLLLLDASERALAETAQVITLSETTLTGERHLFSWAHAHVDPAQAHLQQRDLDAASASLQPVVDMSAAGRIDPFIQHLGQMRQMFTLPAVADAPLARSLQDEIEACQRAALSLQLTT
jgi:hypothetical protein